MTDNANDVDLKTLLKVIFWSAVLGALVFYVIFNWLCRG